MAGRHCGCAEAGPGAAPAQWRGGAGRSEAAAAAAAAEEEEEEEEQEYWSRLPLLTPGDLPDPEIEPTSPASPTLSGRFFTTESPRKPL